MPSASQPHNIVRELLIQVAFLAAGAVLVVVGLNLRHMLGVRSELLSMVVAAFGLLLCGRSLRRLFEVVWDQFFGGVVGGRVHYRVRMPPEALAFVSILLILLLGALTGRSNLLMLVFGLMAGPFVLNGWYSYTMLRGLRVDRHLPQEAMAGQPFHVEISLANRKYWLWSWLVEVHDTVRGDFLNIPAAALFPAVPAKKSQFASYQVTLENRGRYVFGPLSVSSRFPLGLVERQVIREVFQELIVLPRVGRLTPLAHRHYADSNDLLATTAMRRGHSDDEFHGLREYRSGDNPRAIHWRTSARQNQLMIREFHENRHHEVFVILDLWQPGPYSTRHLEQIERAISFAATVCYEQDRNAPESQIGVGVSGQESWFWHGAAGVSLGTFLSRLAVAKGCGENHLRNILSEAVQCHRGEYVQIVSTREDFATVQDAVNEFPSLRDYATLIRADSNELGALFRLQDVP